MEVDAPADAEPVKRARPHPLRAIVGLGTIQALTMAAGLARTKVLATTLGPAGMGVASVIDQVVSLAAQVGSISLPFAALKFLSRLSAPDDALERRRAFTALSTALLVASTLAAVISFFVAAWRPTIFSDGLTPYRLALLVAIAGVPPFAMIPLLRNVMASLEQHRDAAIATFLAAIATVVASYFGVVWGGLVGLYLANAVVSLLTVGAMYRYVARGLGAPFAEVMGLRTAIANLTSQPGLVRFGAALYVLAFTSPIAYLYARSTLLTHHGAVPAGWAAAAYGIAVSLRLVLHQANALYLMPLVNQDTPKHERIAIVGDYLRVLLLIVVLAVLGITLFPELVLVTLYSRTFLGAVHYVALFLIAEATLLLAGVYQSLLVGLDDTIGLLVVTVAGHLVTIWLSNQLVLHFGATGMAAAFLAGNAVILVGGGLRLKAKHGAHSLIKPLVPLALAFAITALIGYRIGTEGLGIVWRVIALAGATGMGFALLRPNELAWLARFTRRRPNRPPARPT